MELPQDQNQDVTLDRVEAATGAARDAWVKPEVTEFKPVTVARGISYRIGDGISNLC